MLNCVLQLSAKTIRLGLFFVSLWTLVIVFSITFKAVQHSTVGVLSQPGIWEQLISVLAYIWNVYIWNDSCCVALHRFSYSLKFFKVFSPFVISLQTLLQIGIVLSFHCFPTQCHPPTLNFPGSQFVSLHKHLPLAPPSSPLMTREKWLSLLCLMLRNACVSEPVHCEAAALLHLINLN